MKQPLIGRNFRQHGCGLGLGQLVLLAKLSLAAAFSRLAHSQVLSVVEGDSAESPQFLQKTSSKSSEVILAKQVYATLLSCPPTQVPFIHKTVQFLSWKKKKSLSSTPYLVAVRRGPQRSALIAVLRKESGRNQGWEPFTCPSPCNCNQVQGHFYQLHYLKTLNVSPATSVRVLCSKQRKMTD